MTQKKRPANRRKKSRRKKRALKKLLILLCVLAVLTFIISLVYTVFQLKAINVTGNQYTASQDVMDWIQEGQFSDNTLYVAAKYNMDHTEQLPSVESVDVKLISPWVVEVQVYEKELTGRIDCGNEFLYFDVDGIACHRTTEVWEGIPYIEGVEIEQDEVKLGERVPVKEEELFEQLSQLSKDLIELELYPDRMVYENKGIMVCFGDIHVMLGSDGFQEKLKQVSPILQKLNEQYPGRTGVLHLENYEAGEETIRFVPDENENEEENIDGQIPDEQIIQE